MTIEKKRTPIHPAECPGKNYSSKKIIHHVSETHQKVRKNISDNNGWNQESAY